MGHAWVEAVSPLRCNLLALGSEALSTHGLPSPSRFSSPQGCHKMWTWSPLALHLPCKGQNPSVPRVPVEEGGKAGGGGWSKIKVWQGLTPKPRRHSPGQQLWVLMSLAQAGGSTQRPRALGLDAGSSTGDKVGRWQSTVWPAYQTQTYAL